MCTCVPVFVCLCVCVCAAGVKLVHWRASQRCRKKQDNRKQKKKRRRASAALCVTGNFTAHNPSLQRWQRASGQTEHDRTVIGSCTVMFVFTGSSPPNWHWSATWVSTEERNRSPVHTVPTAADWRPHCCNTWGHTQVTHTPENTHRWETTQVMNSLHCRWLYVVCVSRWEAVQVWSVFVCFYRPQLSAQTRQNSQSGETIQLSTLWLLQVTHTDTCLCSDWLMVCRSLWFNFLYFFLSKYPEEEFGPSRSPSSHWWGLSMPTVQVFESRSSASAETHPQTPRLLPACHAVTSQLIRHPIWTVSWRVHFVPFDDVTDCLLLISGGWIFVIKVKKKKETKWVLCFLVKSECFTTLKVAE